MFFIYTADGSVALFALLKNVAFFATCYEEDILVDIISIIYSMLYVGFYFNYLIQRHTCSSLHKCTDR